MALVPPTEDVSTPPPPAANELIPHKYKLSLSAQLNPLELELFCYRNGHPRENGGLGRFGHCKKAIELLWPKLIWNDWLTKQIRSLCENQWVCWAGCAGSGKTFGASLYSMVFWLADAACSSVILTSTTAKMIRKRAWAVIQQLHGSTSGFPGNLVDSKMTLQARKGDDKHAIFGIAVAEGNTSKAVANIQGIHTKRQLVIIDEATDTPEAAFEACANLVNGCEEFQCLVIGNPSSHFDPMGKFAEPLEGWSTVRVDDDDWETVVQLNGKPGVCIRFDAEKSPNVLAEKVLFPFLVTQSQLSNAKARYGEASPLFWKYQRGFWAPEGLTTTVFTETMVIQMQGTGKFIFTGNGQFKVGGCDPAFGGGDRPILRFAQCGEIEGGGIGIQLQPPIPLELDAASRTPIHFQLAEQIRKNCERDGCPPENLALDASGEGGGLCDILAREWSNLIIRVESGGKCSDMPVSNEDPRPCSEAYDRKVTELWFSAREFLLAGQLRGLDPATVVEFCARKFDDSKRKIVIEPKKDMKQTFGRSPDLADATAFVIEAAKLRGAKIKAVKATAETGKVWLSKAREFHSVYERDEQQEMPQFPHYLTAYDS